RIPVFRNARHLASQMKNGEKPSQLPLKPLQELSSTKTSYEHTVEKNSGQLNRRNIFISTQTSPEHPQEKFARTTSNRSSGPTRSAKFHEPHTNFKGTTHH